MILARYVLKEHAGPFLFGFSVIMFLLVIDLILQMLDRLLGKGIATGVVVELFFLNTAWMIALAVPMAVLVATLLAFGRLSADGEITAMRALGVGVHRIVLPVLCAGGMLGAGLVWFNDRILPEFNHRARVLMMDIQRKRPAVALEDKAGIVIGEFPEYRLLFSQSDRFTGRLHNVVLYHFDTNIFPTTMVADSGQVDYDKARDEVLLWLFGGQLYRIDNHEPQLNVQTTFEKARFRLGEAGQQLSRSESGYRNDREMTIGMMQQQIAEYEQEIHDLKVDLSGQIAITLQNFLLASDSVRVLGAEQTVHSIIGRVQSQERLLFHRERAADRLRVEIHKKYSIPMACLVFVLVGAPLGIRTRGSSPAVGAGISIGFFLVWWICLIGGEKLADRGVVDPWLAMWFPNMITMFFGVWLNVQIVFERRIRRVLCRF